MSLVPCEPSAVVRGPLSPEEKAQITALAARGFVCGRIAQKLRRNAATINYAMHALGLRTVGAPRANARRGAREIRGYSPEDDAVLVELQLQGCSIRAIACELATRTGHVTSAGSISIRLRMLANLQKGPRRMSDQPAPDDAELVDLFAILRGQSAELREAHRDAAVAWATVALAAFCALLMADPPLAKLAALVAILGAAIIAAGAIERFRELKDVRAEEDQTP